MITHLVSGYMRSGTSMMMGALIAGGMEPFFDPSRDRLNEAFGDDEYRPNPAYYEPTGEQIRTLGFPRQYAGKLLKILYGGVAEMAPLPDGYRVVFMWRDPEEIRQSYEGFFHPRKAPAWLPEGYEERMRLALDHLHNRKDVRSVTELHYRDVVEDPETAFRALRDAGWPVDVVAAAAHVDPSLCRYRLEALEVGI